jgi:Double zinc ribbon
MTSTKPFCPECGKPATGSFCQHCGAKLGGRFCNQCGAKLSPSASFCNQCGNPAAGGSGGHRAAASAVVGGANLPWWIAGVALFGLIVVVGVQMVSSGGPSQPAGVQTGTVGGGAAGTSSVDLASMTPREAADRLFDRVMRAASQGDSAQAQGFLPMAINAYERARPLDADGLFHLSLLQQTSLQLDSALATAEEILAADPDHILGLKAAAEVAAEAGRPDEAAAFYRHLLEVYDAQVARGLPEYEMHSPVMESAKSDAEAFLAGR